MKNILLKNISIINPIGENRFIKNGYISVAGGKITNVGSRAPVEEEIDRVYDMQGKLALPGMINAHTHLYSALALGMPFPSARPKNFVQILESIWWKLDRALDEESVRASFYAGLLECVRGGVTTVIDHHSSPEFIEGSMDLLAEISEEFGIRVCGSYETSDRNGSEAFQKSVEENVRAIVKYKDNDHFKPLFGAHASFTLADESLQIISEEVAEHNCGIHIHAAEDKHDQEDAKVRGYRSVVDRLIKYELINDRCIFAHGLYFDDEDIKVLTEKGGSLVHCPTSNANNRVGMLRNTVIDRLMPGLGTDGMQAEMLREAKEGILIRSSGSKMEENLPDYLQLLFGNNARIASKIFDCKIGRIESGYAADLAVYDYHSRSEINADNFGSHLLFGLGQPVDVMCAGEFILREGGFVNLDEEAILAHSAIQSKKLWDKYTRL